MEKKTFTMIRNYYNGCLRACGSKLHFTSNMCGFLNALYLTGVIDCTEYSKIVKHFKTGTKLTAKAMK